MLCYHADTVVQGLLPIPGQIPLGFGGKEIMAVCVKGMWRAIWRLSFQKQSVEESVPSYIAGSYVLFQVMEKTV